MGTLLVDIKQNQSAESKSNLFSFIYKFDSCIYVRFCLQTAYYTEWSSVRIIRGAVKLPADIQIAAVATAATRIVATTPPAQRLQLQTHPQWRRRRRCRRRRRRQCHTTTITPKAKLSTTIIAAVTAPTLTPATHISNSSIILITTITIIIITSRNSSNSILVQQQQQHHLLQQHQHHHPHHQRLRRMALVQWFIWVAALPVVTAAPLVAYHNLRACPRASCRKTMIWPHR